MKAPFRCRFSLCLSMALGACGGQFNDTVSNGDGAVGGAGAQGGAAGATGGSAGTGGVAATGGSAGTGGVAATGGSAGTGGIAATGGSAGTGGIAATGGSAGTGGVAADAGACIVNTVTFQLNAATGSTTQWCIGQGCSPVWMSIRDSLGNTLNQSNLCTSPCDTCGMAFCPPMYCALPQPLKPGGETTTWDGTYFAPGTCGASATTCASKRCAAAGHYTAVMCATPNASDAALTCANSSTAKQICVEVPFNFPATAPVVGTIGL